MAHLLNSESTVHNSKKSQVMTRVILPLSSIVKPLFTKLKKRR